MEIYLLFVQAMLAKPARGGAKWNLANVILKRLSGCSDKPTPQSIPPRPTRSIHRNSEVSHLAVTITRKLEAGYFQAAIRLMCSEDKHAPNNAKTLAALEAKHPSVGQDRKPACDVVGNARFHPLQVSPEDVIKCLGSFPAGGRTAPRRSIFATF